MSKKMKNCRACGAEIASDAKTCPKCGAKNKPPFYKKWWFYAIIVVIICGAAAGGGQSDSPNTDSGHVSAEPSKGSAALPDNAEGGTQQPGPEPEPEPEPVSYTHYPVTELFDSLSSNALKAEKTFQDQYVEIEGYLSTIDSDGKYIAVGADPENWDYLLQSVQCYIKNDEQVNQIIEMNAGDTIVVRGKIKDVGEILGFQMDIDSIN